MDNKNEKEKENFFEKLLKVSEPWHIENVEEKIIDLNNTEVHIYLNYPRGTKFKCPNCSKDCTTYDSSWRVWRHLNLWQYKTYIHARIPTIKCCDKRPTIKPPWSRDNAHFTLLMEDNMLTLSKMSTIAKASDYVKEYDKILWRVIHYYVNRARDKADFSKVVNIGIDETSKKGHHYITNFVNLDHRKVLYATEGKDHTTIDRFVEDFIAHGGIPENVLNVTCDMSKAFKKGVLKHFINALITIDKFHVISLISDGVDAVRREESKDNSLLKKLDIYGLRMQINLQRNNKFNMIT